MASREIRETQDRAAACLSPDPREILVFRVGLVCQVLLAREVLSGPLAPLVLLGAVLVVSLALCLRRKARKESLLNLDALVLMDLMVGLDFWVLRVLKVTLVCVALPAHQVLQGYPPWVPSEAVMVRLS